MFPALRKGQWGAKVDLKHAYFHIPLSEKFARYTGFSFDDTILRFEAMPFGVNVAPQVFTDFVKVLLKHWRSQGITVYGYLDDLLIVASSHDECIAHWNIVHQTLNDAGFLVNEPKCVPPTQHLEFLGIHVNFEQGLVSIPEKKRKGYRKELGKLLTKSSISLRSAASILGKVRSLLVCFPGLRLLTDELVEFVQLSRFHGYDKRLPVPSIVQGQVKLCKVHLSSWEGRPMLGAPSNRRLAADASDTQLGATHLHTQHTAHRYVPKHIHINLKELHASTLALQSFAQPGDIVHLLVDNSTAFAYLQRQGGRLRLLNDAVREMFTWCWARNVQIRPEWVPSAANPADIVSWRTIDVREVVLSDNIFQQVTRALGMPHLDLYATPESAKCKTFACRWPKSHPHQVLTDTLQASLQGIRIAYAHPPWKIIHPFLNRLSQFPLLKVLIVLPFWRAAPWWPLLLRLFEPNRPIFFKKRCPGIFETPSRAPLPAPRWHVPLSQGAIARSRLHVSSG